MKLKNQDYIARISSASPVELVCITYELILAHVRDAEAELESTPVDEREYVSHLDSATDLLGTLIDSLDMDYELSRTLFPLYIFVNKLLIQSKFSKKAAALKDVRRILLPIYRSWQAVSKDYSSQPVMNNSQTLYAGLTYGRGQLDEFIDEDSSKSFKA